MSHAWVTVVLPVRERTESYQFTVDIAELMAPFDEGISMEPYDEPCWCVFRKQRDRRDTAAEAIAKAQGFPDMKAYGEAMNEKLLIEGGIPPDVSERANKGEKMAMRNIIDVIIPEEKRPAMIAEMEAEEDGANLWFRELMWTFIEWQAETFAPHEIELNETIKAAVDFMEAANPIVPDPGCDECKGTGIQQSTYNPESRWDYYGPREIGPLNMKPGLTFMPVTSGEYANDIVKFSERDFSDGGTFALVTPDGRWWERGKLGWWGMSSASEKSPMEFEGEKPKREMTRAEWNEWFLKMQERFGDHFIAVLDYHI